MNTRTRQYALAAVIVALGAAPACTTFFDTSTTGAALDVSDVDSGDVESNDTDDVGDSTEAPTCATYCRLFQDTCSTTPGGYLTTTECFEHCESGAGWRAGTIEDREGNTIGCRIYHTLAAAEANPEIHCPHAGPTGGNVCGTWCRNYCDLSESVCTGNDALYDDDEQCIGACQQFPDNGRVGDVAGDTVQCRLYHLFAAASTPLGAPIHCPHAATVSQGGVCD